jgi:hypothetical protein
MVDEQTGPDPDRDEAELEAEDNEIDGCDIEIENATLDEDLPETEGGVA